MHDRLAVIMRIYSGDDLAFDQTENEMGTKEAITQ
jgi:hypothetical protein